MQCTAIAVTSTDLGPRAGAPAPPGPNDRRSPSPFSDLGGVKVKWAASHLVLGLAHDQHPPPVWRLLNVKQEKAAKANDASMSQSMSQSSNAVVYALICGLILFIVLPHALAALDRRRFLRRLRRAFESGTLQPLWPADAVVCPREIKDMCHVWTNSVVFGNDEIDLPLLGGFTTLNDHQVCALAEKHPTLSKKVNLGQTLRNRLLAFHRKPSVLPTTMALSTTNPPATPQRFQGTLQFATLITMPSPRTSKLYNTSVNTSCSLPYPARSPIASNCTHRHTNASVVEVSEPRVPDNSSFLSTLHLGVCTKPLVLDGSLIPSPPPPQSPSESETTRRDAPLHPMYRIGYAGGAGVMIVDAPPRRSRDEEDEEDWNHQAWMWRGF